jgi:hypothetical protein
VENARSWLACQAASGAIVIAHRPQWLRLSETHHWEVATMNFWQRVLALLVAVLVISLLFNMLWHWLFNFALPAYVSGLVGGMTAVPVWDALKRIKPKTK